MNALAEERIGSSGGVNIFVRSWQPVGRARGVLVLCHGLNSHSGQYLWAGEQLRAHGLAVYAPDLRGRGRSDGPRFTVNDIGEYVSDLAAAVDLAQAREGDLPLFLLGHSLGGVVATLYALDHPGRLSGLISESFAYRVPASGFALWSIKVLSLFAPKRAVLKLDPRAFTRDPVALQAVQADPLTRGETQPAITVASMVRGNERLRREMPRVTLPVLILHGTRDQATLPAGSQEFFDRAGSTDKTLKLYDGHLHDLLNDLGKEAVMADISSWIDRHLPG
jgi:alpha-beta hydrolase superfamily lysophospholipase